MDAAKDFQPHQDRSTLSSIQTDESSPTSVCVMGLTLFVLIYYLIDISFYIRYEEKVLPFGDPFTYAIGFFKLLDDAHRNYLSALLSTVNGQRNWYWLLNILISVLSPILVKESFSISLVNFLLFWLASLSFFRLGRSVGGSWAQAFLIGMLVWIFPINYGFSTYASVPVTGLDAAFTAALYIALANTLTFAYNPSNFLNASIAGLACGVAVWGRGNSIPTVFMVVCVPLAWVVWIGWQHRGIRVWRNLACCLAIFGGMAVYFYWTNWGPLVEYYSNQTQMASRHPWSFRDARVWLLNIPGYLFWRYTNSPVTIFVSMVLHVFMTVSLWFTFSKERWGKVGVTSPILRVFSAAGVLIYSVTYVTNIVLFTDPLFTLENVLLIYQPMLCGIALVFAVVLLLYVPRSVSKLRVNLVLLVVAGMLIFAVAFTSMQTPMNWGLDRPTPREVERFALEIDGLLAGEPLSILWYGFYNPRILTFYRVKSDLPDLRYYMGRYYNNLWSAVDYSNENREHIRQEVREHFLKSGLIIIPEYWDLYTENQPYALYKFRADLVAFLNSNEAPRLRVLRTLTDHPGARLVVLQREELAHGRGIPFPLPYGKKPDPTSLDFLEPNGVVNAHVRAAHVTAERSSEAGPSGPVTNILEEDTEKTLHAIEMSLESDLDGPRQLSVWLKNAGRNNFRVQITDAFGARGMIANGNLGTDCKMLGSGVYGAAQLSTATIEKSGSGWCKVTLEGRIAPPVRQALAKIFLADEGGQLEYSGDPVKGFMISGLSFK